MNEERKELFEIYISTEIIPKLFIDKNLKISIFELHTNLSDMIKKHFESNQIYIKAVNDGLELFLEEKTGIIHLFQKLHSNLNFDRQKED